MCYERFHICLNTAFKTQISHLTFALQEPSVCALCVCVCVRACVRACVAVQKADRFVAVQSGAVPRSLPAKHKLCSKSRLYSDTGNVKIHTPVRKHTPNAPDTLASYEWGLEGMRIKAA